VVPPVSAEREATPLFPARGPEGTWGYIDRAGTFLIPPQYGAADPFSEGLALVQADPSSVRCIDKAGSTVFELAGWARGRETGIVDGFHDGFARVVADGKTAFVGRSGELLPPRFEEARPFSNGVAAVREDGKWGWMGTDGGFVVSPRFRELGDLGAEGLATASLDVPVSGGVLPRVGFVGRDGELVIPADFVQAKDFSEGLAAVKVDDRARSWGYVDTTGKLVIPAVYSSAGPFREGLAAVTTDRGLPAQFIDRGAKLVAPLQPGAAGAYSEGLAAFTGPDRRLGYMDRTGNPVIPAQFQSAAPFVDGLARVSTKDADRHVKDGYIDPTGAWVYAWESDEPPEPGPSKRPRRP
jgi:hypothetical protein